MYFPEYFFYKIKMRLVYHLALKINLGINIKLQKLSSCYVVIILNSCGQYNHTM